MRKKELKTVITFETTTQAIGIESACKKTSDRRKIDPSTKRDHSRMWNGMDDPFRK